MNLISYFIKSKAGFLLDVKLENGSLTTQWGKLIPVDRGKSPIREFILRNFWSHIRFLEEAGDYTMQFDRFYGKKE